MPTYVYACKACDDRFEIVQKMSDDPLTSCEKCGGDLRKVLFPPAVVYKGSGFYVTDYKNNGKSSASESSSETPSTPKTDAPKTDSPASTKTETKSEATTATATGTAS